MDTRLFIAENDCKRLDVFLSAQTDEFTRSRVQNEGSERVGAEGREEETSVDIGETLFPPKSEEKDCVGLDLFHSIASPSTETREHSLKYLTAQLLNFNSL